MDSQRLKEILESNGSFAIVVGQNYGIDEMGGALSLYLTLESLGKDVSIVSSKEPLVEVSNLVGIDRVRKSFEGRSGDLIVSFPYQTDEIGKVSYTLEGGFLNIIVKPKDAALSFGEKDVIFKRLGEAPSVLIAVGVRRLSELSSLFKIEGLKDTTIVNIDKPGSNEGYGDVVIVGQGASSVSEQISNLMLTLSYPIDPDIAQNLMSGISASTQNFQNPQTSSLAFEMAGILIRNGARRENVRYGQQPRSAQPFGVQPRPTQPFGTPRNVSQQQVRSTSAQTEFPREQKNDEAPPDWLTPKIFKGSTTVE